MVASHASQLSTGMMQPGPLLRRNRIRDMAMHHNFFTYRLWVHLFANEVHSDSNWIAVISRRWVFVFASLPISHKSDSTVKVCTFFDFFLFTVH